MTENGEKTPEAFKSSLYKCCMKRNGISESGWEVIWSISANLEDSDNIFVLSCQDDKILNKAKEEYKAYRDANDLTDDDHEANAEYWRLQARGGEWRVEFANYNPRTGDFFPDSMQPPRARSWLRLQSTLRWELTSTARL